jgi:hypothetical protein
MGRMTRLPLLVAGIFVAATCGCGSDGAAPRKIDATTSAAQSAQYTGALVRKLGQAIAFENGEGGLMEQFKSLLGGVQLKQIPQLSPPAPLPLPLLNALSDTPALKHSTRPRFLTLMSQEESFDETAADVESFLRDRLFAAGNVEADEGTRVVYRLKGDPTCRPLPSRILEGAADQVDAGCASDLEKLQVRIVVQGDGDGYRFQILLGPEKFELSVFVVHTDLLAWEADLAQARKAGDFADMALGRPVAEMPLSSLRGRVRFALQALGEKKVRVSFGVLEGIELQGKPEQPMAFTLGKSEPAIALTADGVAQQLGLDVAWPQTDVRGPWDPMDIDARNTDMHLSLGGLSGKSNLTAGAEQVVISGLGIGPSFMAVRNTKIAELNFNASNGRKMDLTIKQLPGDQARFELSPRMDLSMAFRLSAIAAELSEAPADYLLNETYSLLLSGASPVVVETVAETASFAGGFKMVAGSLSLSTSASAAATVQVPAGKCLSENADPAPGSHPLLGGLAAVDCQ